MMVAANRGGAGLHALTMGLFLAASSAPAPLYRLWEARWGFSPLMLTVVFAAYALALLAALLFCGGVSDQAGRRPVILLAIAGEVAAMATFLCARNVDWLLAARLLQGFSTGLATAALGAAILDADAGRGPLLNAVVPMLGMGAGGLGSGLLVRWAPAPLALVFAILIAGFAVQALRTARTAAAIPALRTGRLRFKPRIAVPAQARGALLAVTPAAVALWALGGFSLSLLPSLLFAVMPGGGSLLGGVTVALLTGGAVIAILSVRNRPAAVALPVGAVLLVGGMALILGGAHAASLFLLIAGAVVAGLGFGAGWLGAVRVVLPLAGPHERAGLMSAFYVECYLASALPVVAAGLAVRRLGLLGTADWFGGAIMVLAGAAAILVTPRLLAERRVRFGTVRA